MNTYTSGWPLSDQIRHDQIAWDCSNILADRMAKERELEEARKKKRWDFLIKLINIRT